MSVTTAPSDSAIWLRTIRPELGDVPAAAARQLMRLTVSGADKRRIKKLSAKANRGRLTDVELEELEHYLSVGRALEFLKAKARLSLSDRHNAA
jgi:hypothetical protein